MMKVRWRLEQQGVEARRVRLELLSRVSVDLKWLCRRFVVHERLCSEAADENDELFLNRGWNVKIIKCKIAYSSILGMVSSPFSPCTLL